MIVLSFFIINKALLPKKKKDYIIHENERKDKEIAKYKRMNKQKL
jgi:hypothetical protein